jgi:hypothetical protein
MEKKTKYMYDKPKHQNLLCNSKCKHLQNDLQIIHIFLQFYLQAYANANVNVGFL